MFVCYVFKLEVEFLWKNGQKSSSGCLFLRVIDGIYLNLALLVKIHRGKMRLQVREVKRGKYLYFGGDQCNCRLTDELQRRTLDSVWPGGKLYARAVAWT